MEKFTKGPWEVFPKESKTRVYCDDAVGSLVADCWTSQRFCVLPREQLEANARLIAAAPEMYKTLQAILNDDYKNVGEMKDQINHILAKVNQ